MKCTKKTIAVYTLLLNIYCIAPIFGMNDANKGDSFNDYYYPPGTTNVVPPGPISGNAVSSAEKLVLPSLEGWHEVFHGQQGIFQAQRYVRARNKLGDKTQLLTIQIWPHHHAIPFSAVQLESKGPTQRMGGMCALDPQMLEHQDFLTHGYAAAQDLVICDLKRIGNNGTTWIGKFIQGTENYYIIHLFWVYPRGQAKPISASELKQAKDFISKINVCDDSSPEHSCRSPTKTPVNTPLQPKNTISTPAPLHQQTPVTQPATTPAIDPVARSAVTLVSITDAPILKKSNYPLMLASILDHAQVVSGPEFTSGQLLAFARSYQDQLLNWYGQAKLDNDPAMLKRVQAIMRRLALQVSNFRSDAAKWPWVIHVVDMNVQNATGRPGGKLIISSEMITTRHLSNDELAAIIGQIMGSSLLNVPANPNHAILRNQGMEADLIGLQLMALAGYDPHAAIKLLRRTANPKSESTFKDPPHYPKLERARILTAVLPQVLPLYFRATSPT